MSVKAKAILPTKFRLRVDDLRALAEETVDAMAVDLNRTVATWKRKPRFERNVRRTLRAIEASVTTADKLYGWINYGTQKGYAEFSKDWSPKTKPDVIGSFPGSGRRTRINYRRPKQGVTPRNFIFIVGEKHQKILTQRASHFFAKAAKNSGHGFS